MIIGVDLFGSEARSYNLVWRPAREFLSSGSSRREENPGGGEAICLTFCSSADDFKTAISRRYWKYLQIVIFKNMSVRYGMLILWMRRSYSKYEFSVQDRETHRTFVISNMESHFHINYCITEELVPITDHGESFTQTQPYIIAVN